MTLLAFIEGVADISRGLSSAQAEITSELSIYNRPLVVLEGLSIIMFHAGLHDTVQVA